MRPKFQAIGAVAPGLFSPLSCDIESIVFSAGNSLSPQLRRPPAINGTGRPIELDGYRRSTANEGETLDFVTYDATALVTETYSRIRRRGARFVLAKPFDSTNGSGRCDRLLYTGCIV